MRKTHLRPYIIETAGALFARKGYGNVGINEIVAIGEIARASFYHHFGSKEGLCVAWLDSLHAHSVEEHEALLRSRKAATTLLQDYFQALKTWLKVNDFRGCPFTNTSTFLTEDAPQIRQRVETHKQFIRDFFVELAHRIDPGKGRELGDCLFLLYSGATTEAQNLRATWPVDSALRCAKQLLAN